MAFWFFLITTLFFQNYFDAVLCAEDITATSSINFRCPSNFGYFTDPADCAGYYICTFGSPRPRKCGDNLIYSEKSKTCDEPKPGGCNSKIATPTGTNDSTTVTEKPAPAPSAAALSFTKTDRISILPAPNVSKEPAQKFTDDEELPVKAEEQDQLPPANRKEDREPVVIATAGKPDKPPPSFPDKKYADNRPPPRRPAEESAPARPTHPPLLNVGETLRKQLAESRKRADNKLPTKVRQSDDVDDEGEIPQKSDDVPPVAPPKRGRYVRPVPAAQRPVRPTTTPAPNLPVVNRPPPRPLLQPGQPRSGQSTTRAPPVSQQTESVDNSRQQYQQEPDTRQQKDDERKTIPEVKDQRKFQKHSPPEQSDFDYDRATQPQADEQQNRQQQQKFATSPSYYNETPSRHERLPPLIASALPPADKLSPALPLRASKCIAGTNCHAPRCYCGGVEVPGNLPPDQVPQMVMISFDGPVNERNLPLYEELFDNAITNPNGCPIRGTFFISHEFTNYGMVRHLYEKNHGIASHSISHGNGAGFRGTQAWRNQLLGEKLYLSKFAAIRPDYIKGARAPMFACGGDEQFEAMGLSGLIYDSSLPVPSTTRAPQWPFTLDHGMPYQCVIPPCPEHSHPGIWEIPLNPIYGLFGESCFAVDRCNFGSSTDQVFSILYNNFYRNHYQTNRAPFQLALHADWLNYQPYKSGYVKFISVLASMPDVWFLTGTQIIDWMQQPVNSRDAIQFQPWQCPDSTTSNITSISGKPPCKVINACPLPYEKKLRYFYTCSDCPRKFPWLDEAKRWILERDKESA